MTTSAEDGHRDRIQAALARITRWMSTHGAPLLAENLAPGASPEALAEVEAALAFALPADLRALWSLHDGQREEGNGFVEAFDLLSSRQARAEQETVLMSIEFLRERPDAWGAASVREAEVRSDHWLPFAARDSDSLAVSGVTGRVFACDHDDSPKLLAASIVEWLERYAVRVEADDYAVEEGFGDYYLRLRDRDAERRKHDRDQRMAERERYRRETPLLDQLREALARRDDVRCTEVLEDALQRDDRATFDDAVGMLFASSPAPTFVASALRPVLRAATLTPGQWVDVAIGGALQGNHAVRDLAIARCAEVSMDRLERLERAVTAAGPERRALEDVLRRIREKTSRKTETHRGEPRGSWLSRLLGKRRPKA